jgi:hypothetical protein
MSLLRLLTSGKSLVGMQDTNSRYRMRTRNLLPKFGSGQNPFAAPSKASASPKPAEPDRAKLETASLFEPATPATPTPPKTIAAKEPKKAVIPPVKAPEPVIKLEAKAPAAPAASSKPAAPFTPTARPAKSGRWSDWIRKFNPASALPWKWGEMGGRKRPARRAVQTELTLDQVRVVRNDLSDTDFDIVPGRLMGMHSGASPILPHPQREEPRAWNRLTAKFLGAQHAEIH